MATKKKPDISKLSDLQKLVTGRVNLITGCDKSDNASSSNTPVKVYSNLSSGRGNKPKTLRGY